MVDRLSASSERSIVRATLLEMFDGLFFVGPVVRILRQGCAFRGFVAQPRAAVHFFFACCVFGSLLLKWESSPTADRPVAPCVITAEPRSMLGGPDPCNSAAMGALMGELCFRPQQPTTGVWVAGWWHRPECLVERANKALQKAFPGLPAKIEAADLFAYAMVAFVFAFSIGVHAVLRLGARIAPRLFDRRLMIDATGPHASHAVAATFYATGTIFLIVFLGVAVFHFIHVTNWMVGALSMATLALLAWAYALIVAWWLPRWLGAIHGIGYRDFLIVNAVAELPLVVTGLVWFAWNVGLGAP